ncbi:FHIPEP family type III secretion protein [Paenarthrobacter sp. C1]|uniref:FHIPEP family type III secretion protein n=1 Tax=Paenarthrobacter sp. C1 TaxID=3400220 RepID=UPI003BF563A5
MGRETVDPAFGMPAVWVTSTLADAYRRNGATVIDRGTVLVTHLGELVRRHAHEVCTRQDLRRLLDALKETAPGVVAEYDDPAALSDLHEVVRELLVEQVPVRQLERIAESVAAARRTGRTLDQVVEATRTALAATICMKAAPSGTMRAVTFEPALEGKLVESVRPGEAGAFLSLDPMTMSRLLEGASAAVAQAEATGERIVMVCHPSIRSAVRRLFVSARPDLPVLSYAELVRTVNVEVAAEIGLAAETVPAGSRRDPRGEWFRDHITVHHKPAETDDGLHGELIVSGPSLDAVRNWVSGAYPDAVLVSWSRYGLTGRCVRGMFVPNPDQDLADLAADALAFLAAAATTSAGSATIPVIAAAAAEPKPSRATRKKAEQAEQAESSTVSTRDTARDSVCDDSWSADAFALLNSIGIEFGQHVDPLPAGQDNDVRFSVPLRHTHPTPTPEPARPARPAVRRELVSTSRAPKPPEPAPAYGSPRRAALPSQVAAAGLGEQQETILVDTLSAAAAAGRPEEPRPRPRS